MSDKINNHDDEYEKNCYMCRRPESVTGKMIRMGGNIDICPDCMQKAMDSISSINFNDMPFDMFGSNMGFGGPMPASYDEDEIEETEDNDSDEDETEDEKSGDDKSSEKSDDKKSKKDPKIPNIRFINMSDFGMGMGNRQKVKKKKKNSEPIIDINKIPAPHIIKQKLDEYVIGQEQAKKIISVAVYNHYKRVATNTMDEIEIEKSNMLMIGPTGCGKTYLVKTLAKLLDVPLAIADATSLTEAGYIGDDIESVVSKLLAAADNDVEKAESGIVFIDEIDKLAKKKNTTSRDVSGESVQQGLLKLLEGSEVEVPVGSNSKNMMVPLTTINTKNILFICGGAFPELDDIIKERLNKQSSIGFNADLKDKYDNVNDIVKNVTIEDLRSFGMIPEFLGRLPIIYTLDGLTEEMLVKVLKEPKNAIIKQYQKLLELDEVELKFDDAALEAIAKKAVEKKTGARALRSIIEEFMLDIMYEIPKDDNIGIVTITKEYIEKTGGPVIQMRGIEKTSKEAVKSIEEKVENGIEENK
ncbi:MAG: ATP-dependent Clp protease ATP-binding subunit ClpX [Lachnospiraceae bacterium]|nr:ATP-dependent Clp protease ATP-binding subunit ClpX [Lachnospiraceae bacterium]